MLQRMRNFCLLMLPLLFLAGMLYLQGTVSYTHLTLPTILLV